MTKIKDYLWILPFFSFIIGYYVTQSFFQTPCIVTPHLVGKYVHEILPLLSDNKLIPQIISQKIETAIPEGIIIKQIPQPGTAIKAHQYVYITTTKKPYSTQAPLCIGKDLNTLLPELLDKKITPRIYVLPHTYPENMCFAQSPEVNEILEKNTLIIYASVGNHKPVIWPNFIGLPLTDVTYFLETYEIKPYIINDTPTLQSPTSIIIDQRPTPGTLITLDKNSPLSVQFRIQQEKL